MPRDPMMYRFRRKVITAQVCTVMADRIEDAKALAQQGVCWDEMDVEELDEFDVDLDSFEEVE